jgi:hypothetical protein
MSVEVPQVGVATGVMGGWISLVGVGDFLFLGLLFGAVRRLELDLPQTTAWVVVLMALALVGVRWWGAAMPGLLFICGAGLIANRRYFRFTREERQALLIAFLILSLLVLAGLLGLRCGKIL